MTATTRSETVISADGTTIAYHTVGTGDSVIVVGGSLTTGEDYLALGQSLAPSFTVHLIDRRGRSASGPQGPGYSIDKECDDLLAVATATGSQRVFGHSYGGLVALETARRSNDLTHVAVYEPGVSINGSIPDRWMAGYARLLAQGDTRGAFASMVKGGGFVPRGIEKLPLLYFRAILRLVIRKRRWRQIEPLLQTNLAEHQQVVRLDSTIDAYASIRAPVLLLGGSKSPETISLQALRTLHHTIPNSALEIIDGLDHFAPDEKAPNIIGTRLLQFLG